MLRVVLDTNVVVSALLHRHGAPSKVFELFLRNEILNCTTTQILAEVRTVLARPKIKAAMSTMLVEFTLSSLQMRSMVVVPVEHVSVITDDPADNMFLECALAAEADYIITGDRHLLNLHLFRGIPLVSPAQFLDIWNKRLCDTQ
jgi:uncharacterized protein